MPPRSKVITMLPAHIRQEVERRLFENGFSDCEGLAQWVRGQGYEISDDSLWRYGHGLQQRLAAMRLTVRLAGAMGELADDNEALMARALITIAQQKALESLAEKEEVTPGDLNAIANLTRAAIAQQRWAAQMKRQGQQPRQAALDGKCGLDNSHPRRNSLSANAPRERSHAAALAASEEPAGRSEPGRETSPGAERRAPREQPPPQTGVVVDGTSITARDTAFVARIEPALYPASPRIAADLRAEESSIPVAYSSLRRMRSPCVARGSTQIDADLRT